ncbi:MAG: hypothetical protein LBP86_02575 [Azoarcus sp.]|nr:hypothetical protein [Azoarcus sp.]
MFVLLCALAPSLPALAASNGAPTVVYGCEVNGRWVYGDTLPQECIGRAWIRKVNGITVFRAKRPPTSEDLRFRAAVERCKNERGGQIRARENQRISLLERYPSVSDLDAYHNNEIERLDGHLADLRAREQDIIGRRQGYDDDVKALEARGKPMTPDLATTLHYVDQELARQRAMIADKLRDRDKTRQKFDEERRAYLEVTVPEAPVDLGEWCTEQVSQSTKDTAAGQ